MSKVLPPTDRELIVRALRQMRSARVNLETVARRMKAYGDVVCADGATLDSVKRAASQLRRAAAIVAGGES